MDIQFSTIFFFSLSPSLSGTFAVEDVLARPLCKMGKKNENNPLSVYAKKNKPNNLLVDEDMAGNTVFPPMSFNFPSFGSFSEFSQVNWSQAKQVVWEKVDLSEIPEKIICGTFWWCYFFLLFCVRDAYSGMTWGLVNQTQNTDKSWTQTSPHRCFAVVWELAAETKRYYCCGFSPWFSPWFLFTAIFTAISALLRLRWKTVKTVCYAAWHFFLKSCLQHN